MSAKSKMSGLIILERPFFRGGHNSHHQRMTLPVMQSIAFPKKGRIPAKFTIFFTANRRFLDEWKAPF